MLFPMGMLVMSVATVCEARWDKYFDDCSGFVKAVAADLGVTIDGQANDIVDAMQKFPWKRAASGADAALKASMGYLVLGGLKAAGNGHVVVIVPGVVLEGKYPTAYWGSLNSIGKKNTTINWSWSKPDRDLVQYAYYIGKSGEPMSASLGPA
jgi:hypothetical protein